MRGISRQDVGLVLIVAFALYLRAVNLPTVPQWMWDEGANVNYAANLAEGRLQHFGYRYHFMPHPPLYFALLAPLFKVFGADMTVLRLFSVACSLAGLILTYRIVRDAAGGGCGLAAALAYALYPELIFWGRLGFGNNLLAALALASAYFLVRFLSGRRRRDLICCCVLTGLCPVTEYAGVAFIVALGVVLRLYAPEHLAKALAISAAPLILFAASMLAFDADGFLKDAGNYFSLYPLALPLLAAGALILDRLVGPVERTLSSLYYGVGKETPAELIVCVLLSALALVPVSHEAVVFGRSLSAVAAMSFLGLFLIPNENPRNVLLVYLGCYLTLLMALNRWDHTSIPLHYLACGGSAFLMGKAASYARGRIPAAAALVALPLAVTFWADVDGFAFKGVGEAPAAEFGELTGFINDRTEADDLVVSFTYLAPQAKARTALFIEAVAYHGYRFGYLNRDYTQEDFIYNHSFGNIEYMVLPQGFVEQLNHSEYGGVTSGLAEWPAVYRVDALRMRNPGLGSAILGYIGVPVEEEAGYVVLENPGRREGGDYK